MFRVADLCFRCEPEQSTKSNEMDNGDWGNRVS